MFKKPIKYYLLYIVITLLISFFGPAKYINYDKISVFLFMLTFMICISLGYFAGLKIKLKPFNNKAKYNKNRTLITSKCKDMLPLLELSIIISVIGVLVEIVELLMKNPSAFSLSNIGSNYIQVRQYLAVTSGYSLGLLIRFFTGFFRIIVMTIGIYDFKKLRKKYRLGIVAFYILTILVNSIAYGTQKVIGDMLIYTCVIALIKIKGISAKKRRKIYRIIIFIGIIFTAFVVTNQVQRYEQIGVDVFNYGDSTLNGVYFDTDNIIFKIFGYRLGFGLSSLLTSYLSAGYYGLSLCFKLPFKWTYGIGSSYVLSKFLNKYLGLPNVYFDSYLYRMEIQFGRKGAAAFNTIFPWLASDLSFIGSLLIFIPIGMVFAISWKEVVRYGNRVSILMFATIFLGIIFVPANNQLFTGIDGFISTYMIFFYWIFNHKKYNYNDE